MSETPVVATRTPRRRSPRPAATGRRQVGRPPKIDRQMIAEAAHELGLTGLTMKAVADRLGVSVPGLYHHIDGKDDLLRLAAEYSASRLQQPHDTGQHWAVWLYEWAMYNRGAFVEQPELLKQYMEGAIGVDRTTASWEVALTRLVDEGFTIPKAVVAYSTVSEYAVGAAVNTIREQRATSEGRPAIAELHRVLAQSPRDEYPNVRKMVADHSAHPRDDFHAGLLSILRGLAEERSEPWARVKAKLPKSSDAAVPPRR
jgi:AcrR family transcriptional regulator